jgi:hypothetical protein
MPLLPVLRITRDAYLSPLKRLGQVLASTWLHVSVTFATPFLLIPGPGTIDFESLARSAIWCLTAAPAALAWHRWVLLGEPINARSALRFNTRTIRFALLLLLVDVFADYLSASALRATEGIVLDTLRKIPSPLNMIAITPFIAIPAVLSAAILARLVLVFPLCALDQRARLLRSAWTMSRGNALRIFVVTALATAPLAVLPFAPMLLSVWSGFFSLDRIALLAVLTRLLLIPNDFLSVPIAACAASLVYRSIAPERTDAPDQAQPGFSQTP